MEESVSGQDDTNPVFSLATSAAKMVRYRCTRAKGPNGRSLSPFHQYETPRSIATAPSERDASPSQGYRPAVCRQYPFYTPR